MRCTQIGEAFQVVRQGSSRSPRAQRCDETKATAINVERMGIRGLPGPLMQPRFLPTPSTFTDQSAPGRSCQLYSEVALPKRYLPWSKPPHPLESS